MLYNIVVPSEHRVFSSVEINVFVDTCFGLGGKQRVVNFLLTLLVLDFRFFLLLRDTLKVSKLCRALRVREGHFRVELEQSTTTENLHGLTLALALRGCLGFLFLHLLLKFCLLLELAFLLPGFEALGGDRRQAFRAQRGTVGLDLLLKRLRVLGFGFIGSDSLRGRVLLADDDEALGQHVTVAALFSAVRTDPPPTIQLVFDRIQKVFARNDSVVWHVFGALARVLVDIDLLIGAFFFDNGILNILLGRENGRKQRILLG